MNKYSHFVFNKNTAAQREVTHAEQSVMEKVTSVLC